MLDVIHDDENRNLHIKELSKCIYSIQLTFYWTDLKFTRTRHIGCQFNRQHKVDKGQSRLNTKLIKHDIKHSIN